MVCDLPVAKTNDAEDKRISLFKNCKLFSHCKCNK